MEQSSSGEVYIGPMDALQKDPFISKSFLLVFDQKSIRTMP